MRLPHLALAILITAIWGFNFVAIHLGLQQVSPLLLCTLRFLGVSLPAIFFVKRPAVPFNLIILYGLFMFALQFSLVFLGMQIGVTPGLSSLLMQSQVFFTLLLALLFLNESPNKWQILGALISCSGMILVGLHLDSPISFVGFILIIAAAFSWSVGNLVSKKIGKVNMFSLVVWGSFVASVPLFFIALFIDGAQQIVESIQHLSWTAIAAILYIIYFSTIVGYVGWSWLLARYPAIIVAPFTLLIPLFAFISSALFLNEPLQSWKLTAAALVIIGLCINLLTPRFILRFNRLKEAIP